MAGRQHPHPPGLRHAHPAGPRRVSPRHPHPPRTGTCARTGAHGRPAHDAEGMSHSTRRTLESCSARGIVAASRTAGAAMNTSETTLFDGISSRIVTTSRLATQILERAGDDPGTPPHQTVVFVHGNVSSALFWQEIMLALPSDLRVIAVDLRGFGGSESQPVDATRGLRDFSDDIAALFDDLGLVSAHLVGWSMGGGVVVWYALEDAVVSLTQRAPVSPSGFGGTGRDGTRLTDDDAGCGAGGANPDFVQRLQDRDTGADAQTSPRSVFRS